MNPDLYAYPVMIALDKVLEMMCHTEIGFGENYVNSEAVRAYDYGITVGFFGEINGNISLKLTCEQALQVISKMMMSDITQIDYIGESALSELMNMIGGNAAILYANNGLDVNVSVPEFHNQEESLDYNTNYEMVIHVPLAVDELILEFEIGVLK